MQTAGEVFREVGYTAASMSLIAARVGGSKGTLYNYFTNKEELFAAYVQDYCGRNAEAIFALPMDGGDTVAVLTGMAERFIQLVTSEDSSALFGLLVEARRDQAIARAFYDSGPATGVHRLAAFLERACAAGTIAAEDCAVAAEQFLDLCCGQFHLKRLLKMAPSPTKKELRARAAHVVRFFMRAYGATPAVSAAPTRRRAALRL